MRRKRLGLQPYSYPTMRHRVFQVILTHGGHKYAVPSAILSVKFYALSLVFSLRFSDFSRNGACRALRRKFCFTFFSDSFGNLPYESTADSAFFPVNQRFIGTHA
jgi:hypothetical protein